jgi:hypothetical protein
MAQGEYHELRENQTGSSVVWSRNVEKLHGIGSGIMDARSG